MIKKINRLLLILLLFCVFLKVQAEDEEEVTNQVEQEQEEPVEVVLELKNIEINGDKNVNCSDYVCKYTINDASVEKVKITYEATDGTVTPTSINDNLKEGENKFEVKISKDDKEVKYVFEINKKKLSTDSSLKSLTVNGQNVKLDQEDSKCVATVSYATKKLDIEATPNDSTATVIDFTNNKASFDFTNNSKEIKIKVKSEAGDMKTYVLTVTRRSEADVTLKSLTIENYDIDFSKEVTDYELKVLRNVNKLNITAKASNSNADVKINNPNLQIGENTITVVVTNDGSTNTYTIKVTKLDEDDKTLANLKSLTIEDYDIDFSPDKYEYDLKIGNVNYLKIKAVPKLSEAEAKITGNLDLENGSIIKIKVTYDKELYNVYKINIIKDEKVLSKEKVSKKAIIFVMAFDIISMISLGILQIRTSLKKASNTKKTNKTNKDENDIIDII